MSMSTLKIVTEEDQGSDCPKLCAFCKSSDISEIKFGPMFELDKIVTHYFCLLFSAGLSQQGNKDDGILGFLPEDIQKEIRRSRLLKCSYCKKIGAGIGCWVGKCGKSYHYPCGLKNNASFQFLGNFESYCLRHAKPHTVTRTRRDADWKCPICMAKFVEGERKVQPNCCSAAVYHRECMQKLALDAGHIFTCPNCNKGKNFVQHMRSSGIFIPEQGNIGCPNSHFLRLIRECKLPPSLIKKLGLEFPRARRYRKYSKVPHDYGTGTGLTAFPEEQEILTGRGHRIQSVIHNSKSHMSERVESADESDADDDEDRCEEWERHEALHDEVTSHGGIYSQTKERLYEEKIELKWEKGGSGLVFYTDAQYWDAEKGGFDERTADDWDVDMEGYYVPGGGDKDARDLLEMRQSERFQKGLEHISVFSRSESHYRPSRAKSSSPTPSTSRKIGDFEKYTKGIGRKLMEKEGWHDGIGIGKSTIGMVDALENDGKGPRDRCGLGYYGEKLNLGTGKKRPKKFHEYSVDSEDRVIIGTIFDKPEELDVEEPLLRRNAPTFVKRYDVQTPKFSKLVKRGPEK